jgi:hypothetical protein
VVAGMGDGDPVSHAFIMAIWMAIFKMSPERRARLRIRSSKRKGDGWTTRMGRLTVQVPRALLETAAGLGPNPRTEVGSGRDDPFHPRWVSRVAPRADPDVRNSRIRLLGPWVRYAGRPRAGVASG